MLISERKMSTNFEVRGTKLKVIIKKSKSHSDKTSAGPFLTLSVVFGINKKFWEMKGSFVFTIWVEVYH